MGMFRFSLPPNRSQRHTLLQDRERRTRRAPLWQRIAEGWKIIYHQGTIVKDV
jgi:hypothetical protein